MSLLEDFKKFLFRGNVVDLAIAVVIGASFGKIVGAFVDDLVMPLVSPLVPGGDWRNATFTPLNFRIGHLLGAVLDFVVVATVIFFVLVKFVALLNRKKVETVIAPAVKACPECLEVVPAAARRCKFCTSVFIAVALLLFAVPALAQPAPKFEFAAAPADDKPAVEWAAQAKGGLLLTSGNSQSTSGNLSLAGARRAGNNRLSLDAMAAYGESRNRVIPAVVTSEADITRAKVVVVNTMLARARYDRFLTTRNSVYGLAQVARDTVARKEVFGGAQVGYSRLLVATAAHEVVGEVGYDFSYESYVAATSSVVIHSARLLIGEVWKVSDDTGVYANAEILFNLNRETNALDSRIRTTSPDLAAPPSFLRFNDAGVAPFRDTRVNAKFGLTTKLWKNLSFGFGITARYDQNPALIAQSPVGPPAPSPPPTQRPFRAFANSLDVITDASLILSLL